MSKVTFTLDTICPWTYLARVRLKKALDIIEHEMLASHSPSEKPAVTFTIHYAPYQLYPEASFDGVDKRAWYLEHKYNGSEEHLQKYEALMLAYFLAEQHSENARATSGADASTARSLDRDINTPFRLTGMIANTLPAHRLLQHVQAELGGSGASASWRSSPTEALLSALYELYFARGAHPGSTRTLLNASERADLHSQGFTADQILAFLEQKPEEENTSSERLVGTWAGTRKACREQADDGVDAVPHVAIEGRRRDFTLVGCKNVDEYVKALRAVVKESR